MQIKNSEINQKDATLQKYLFFVFNLSAVMTAEPKIQMKDNNRSVSHFALVIGPIHDQMGFWIRLTLGVRKTKEPM